MIKKLAYALLVFVFFNILFPTLNTTPEAQIEQSPPADSIVNLPSPTPTPTPTLQPIPNTKILPGGMHSFQTFNNCGPASLSMALSLMGITKSQIELGQELRPYQIPNGDNDDKSVTLYELASKAEEFGFITYYRPNGNIDLIKKFIANNMPVIVRTVTKPGEDIGHYRVIKGYDETEGVIIQDDSLQGKNLKYTYSEYTILWEKFNYEYLVLVPPDMEDVALSILGVNANSETAWENAVEAAKAQLGNDPTNIYARFNLSVALYHTGNYQQAAAEFEKVDHQLPFRTLWYQIEPILAYQKLGNYQRVLTLTTAILQNGNRAYSELYQIRGEIFESQGNTTAAQQEFAKAQLYNTNFFKYWE